MLDLVTQQKVFLSPGNLTPSEGPPRPTLSLSVASRGPSLLLMAPEGGAAAQWPMRFDPLPSYMVP